MFESSLIEPHVGLKTLWSGIGAVGIISAFVVHSLTVRGQRKEVLLLKQHECLADLHSAMCDTEQLIEELGAYGTPPERIQAAREEMSIAIRGMYPKILRSRIWLRLSICDVMDSMWSAYKDAGYLAWDFTDENSPIEPSREELNESRRAQKEARLALESHMRKLFGAG